MNDIYREYIGIEFPYFYPITWDGRTPEYLEVVEQREEYQDYMFPPINEEDNVN